MISDLYFMVMLMMMMMMMMTLCSFCLGNYCEVSTHCQATAR
jgi:hypothetical protein